MNYRRLLLISGDNYEASQIPIIEAASLLHPF